MITENYLATWTKSARETLAEARVGGFMRDMLKSGLDLPVEEIIGEVERHSREYAVNWATVADKHELSGLYRKIAEFANVGDGVYVDVGCGVGNLLCALPRNSRLIGVDINP